MGAAGTGGAGGAAAGARTARVAETAPTDATLGGQGGVEAETAGAGRPPARAAAAPAAPGWLRNRPVAHRGLHTAGVPENSLAAYRAAAEAGYAIELDVQPARTGEPLAFHDDDLGRLTGTPGPVAALTAGGAAARRLLGTAEAIPTLAQVLQTVAGRVPLLIEIKDQDGALGPEMGGLPAAVARTLDGYAGEVAVMSFNPHAVAAFRAAGGRAPVGLTTCGFVADDWPGVDAATRARLAEIADFDRLGACFISHDHDDLGNAAVAALAARGVAVLCWTIRSPAEEAAARRVADNITFEGYDTPCAC